MTRIMARCLLTSLAIAYSTRVTAQQPVVSLDDNLPNRIERDACFSRAVAAAALFRCGELTVAHSMPAFRTMDEDHELTLLYSSSTALPQPIIRANISITGTSAPDSIYALLQIGNLTYYFRFSGQGFVPGGPARRVALRYANVDAGLSTGLHLYAVRVFAFHQGNVTPEHADTSTNIVIDRSNSPYGAGWDVAGTERLWFGHAGGVIHSSGDGSAVLYETVAANIWRRPLGAYRDTLRYSAISGGPVPDGNWYWRRLLDGTRVFFDEQGYSRFIVDRYGNTVEHAYETIGGARLLRYIGIPPNPDSLRYTFNYTSGTLTSIVDPGGRALTAVVSGGLLVLLRNPGAGLGAETQFEYEANFLRRRRSPRGYDTYFAPVDATNMLRQVTLPGGDVINVIPTDVLGIGIPFGGPPRPTVALADVIGKIDGPRTDVADTTRFTVNAFGAPLSVTDPVGLSVVFGYQSATLPLLPTTVTMPDGQTYTVKYDASGRDTAIVNSVSGAASVASSLTYGSNNAREIPTRIIVDRAGGKDTTTYTISAAGLINRVTDPRKHRTTFNYNARGQPLTIREDSVFSWVSASVPDRREHQTTRLTYQNGLGNVDTVVSPLGARQSIIYDGFGRPASVRDPLNALTSFSYTDMNWPATTTQYDSVGNALTTDYDVDDEGNVTSRTDARGVVRIWAYDGLNRMYRMTDEFGVSETRTWSQGVVTALETRDQYSILFGYDAAGRERSRIIPAMSVRNATDSSRYLASVGTVLLPADTIQTFYNGVGRIDSVTNASAVVSYTYDLRGRPYSETQRHRYPGAAGAAFTHEYTHAPTGERLTYEMPSGRLHTYAYQAGSLLQSISTSGARPGTFVFEWDQLRRPRQITYPSAMNGDLTYRYDRDGRLRRYVLTRHQQSYDSVALRKFNVYDVKGQLLEMQDSAYGPGQGLAPTQTFAYTAEGYLKYDATSISVNRYRYDRVGNRLTAIVGNITTNYEYDPTGSGQPSNRLSRTREYINGNNVSTERFLYDYDGDQVMRRDSSNTLSSDTTRAILIFDPIGRLRKLPDYTTLLPNSQSDPDTLFMYYDGLGRLIRRHVSCLLPPNCGDQSPRYFPATLAYDGVNVSVRGWGRYPGYAEFLHGPGVDEPLRGFMPNKDPQMCGTVTADSVETYFSRINNRQLGYFNQEWKDCSSFQAWTQYGSDAGGIVNSYRFTLGRNEAGTGGGVSYFRNRWYDAGTGRFLSEDPLGFGGGANLYVYGNNNPASYTDPFGLCPPVWKCLADVGAGLTPGVSTVHDATTAVSGRNVITGENVGVGGRLVAAAAVFLPVSGAHVQAGTRFLSGAVAKSFGRVVGRGTVDLGPTLDRIASGARGAAFENREGLLPTQAAGYYQKFTVPTPGVKGAGPQRLIVGAGGEMYYTSDHYQTFTRINRE